MLVTKKLTALMLFLVILQPLLAGCFGDELEEDLPTPISIFEKFRAYASGLDDQRNFTSIDLAINSSTNQVKCRAYLPSNTTWFSGKIRIDTSNQLIIPREMLTTKYPEPAIIQKVTVALDNCRSSLIYLKGN